MFLHLLQILLHRGGGGIENSPKTYAAEEKVDNEVDSKEVVDEKAPLEDNKAEELEGLEVAPEVEKQAVGSEENKSITYKNYETEVKYSDELAFGDYRIEQEGVLGQYEGDKEIVAPVNKIMTVGTNKDLVKKIKYSEKYSIEDPGTFDYTEHALKNIKTTNTGLQRAIYHLTEQHAPYNNEEGNKSLAKYRWKIDVTIEDGADLSKEFEELHKLASVDNNFDIQDANRHDQLLLRNHSELGGEKDNVSYMDVYMDVWLLNKTGQLNDRASDTQVLDNVDEYINNFMDEFNSGLDDSWNDIRFFVNNNYKTPFVIKGKADRPGKADIIYLTRDLFDEIYPKLISRLRALPNEYDELVRNNVIWVNPIFAEDPESLKFDYDDKNLYTNNLFTIYTWEYNSPGSQSPVYPDDESIVANDTGNYFFAQKLNPDKVYAMKFFVNDIIENDASIFTHYDAGDYNYFYYNVKNIPYFGDETLNFKEKKLIEGDGKKNVVLPFAFDIKGLLNVYRNHKLEYLSEVENNNVDPKEKEKVIKEYDEFINRLEEIDRSGDFSKIDEFISINESLSPLFNKQYLDFLNNDSWGDKISNYAIGNVDTKVEEKDFKVIEKEDPELAKGETKVLTEGVKGKKVTKITYKVNRINGELTDPVEEVIEDIKPVDKVVLVGTKKVTPATPIEDIAKTTKTTNEVIKAKVVYEADEELAFEEQVVDKAPVDGEKEITTVSQSGKEDVVTEDIIKEPEDGKTRVGNKKVEVKNNEDGSTTTTTTIYDVNPDTGELENPRSTSKTTMPATPIEDIAKTTKITNEVIKAKIQYEADDTLGFEENKVIKTPVDGEKEITTVSQSGKEDVVTEEVIKPAEDGKTRVGNKKVEVKNNEDGSTTTTTTIYDVNPDTGELENPRSTSTTVKKPQNELYEPEGADQTTDVNKPLNPEDFITNIKDLPEDTKFEFEEQPDFDKPGESKVKIVATYPDGTKDTVESKLTVNDVKKPSISNKTNVTPNTVKPATTAAPTRTNVKAQTGGGVGTLGGLIAGLTAAAGSIFKRRKK